MTTCDQATICDQLTMQECLRSHPRGAGVAVAAATSAVELAGLCGYVAYYAHFLHKPEDRFATGNSLNEYTQYELIGTP